jgi:hypothetical protein
MKKSLLLKLQILFFLFTLLACKKNENSVSIYNDSLSDTLQYFNDTLHKEEIKEGIKEDFKGYLPELNKEKINLSSSDKFLMLNVEDISAETVEYAFKLQKDKYSEQKFKEGINFIVKYKIKNISNEKLIFKDEDYLDYSLYIISGSTDIEKLAQKYPRGSATSSSELKEKGRFILPHEQFEEHSLEKNETFTKTIKYFSNVDPNIEDLYFGGYITKSESGNLFRVFFKIKVEKVNSVYKVKIVEKQLIQIDEFINLHFFRNN